MRLLLPLLSEEEVRGWPLQLAARVVVKEVLQARPSSCLLLLVGLIAMEALLLVLVQWLERLRRLGWLLLQRPQRRCLRRRASQRRLGP